MLDMGYFVAFGAGFLLAAVLGAAVVRKVLRKRSVIVRRNKDNANIQLQELSKLTGILAHELKNPLSIIKVNLKLLGENLEENDIERVKRKFPVIRNEIERLEDILGNFLNFIGDSSLQAREVDINSVVDNVIDFYSPQAWKKNIKLRFARFNDKLTCRIDEAKFKQVLLNLFLNAQTAMESGGELMVLTSRESYFAKIVVTDTGVGIEPEKIDKIFDAFYTSRTGGTGLGLATAKKLVEMHQGSLSVESEPGKGTSFTILLPLVE